MKTVITAKLKLTTTKEPFAALRATQLAYSDSLNFVSHYAFAQGKISNAVSPTLTYQYGKDYSFKCEQQAQCLSSRGVSLSPTLDTISMWPSLSRELKLTLPNCGMTHEMRNEGNSGNGMV